MVGHLVNLCWMLRLMVITRPSILLRGKQAVIDRQMEPIGEGWQVAGTGR